MTIVLHYLLHQDLHGRCQGLVAVFPFFQKPLREVLRWPYQQRQLRSFEGRLDWHFPRYLAKQLQYRNSYWVEQQLLAYQAGQNLLTRSLADWYPQLVPVKPVEGFRLQSDLERDYEQQFLAFYAQSSSVYRQVLYSPFYYKRELQRLCLQFSPSCGYFFWNLDGEKQELVLHYLLHQDLHGRCQGLVAVFPFFQKPLREVLRWPYQQRQLRSFEGRLDWHFPRYLAKQLQYRNSYWVEQQLLAYQAGQNLLTRSLADWYPQLVPVKPVEGFRLQSDLERDYEQQFLAFYAQSSSVYRQVLYSPFYYKRECDKIGTMEEINS